MDSRTGNENDSKKVKLTRKYKEYEVVKRYDYLHPEGAWHRN